MEIHTADIESIARARRTGWDDNGNPVQRLTASGGEPLRCCLDDAQPGERIMLMGYRPGLPASPYVETGAIFVHAGACTGPASVQSYPDAWRGRAQVLRAYDERGWIHPASTTHDGADPEAALAEVLAQPGVVEVHSRNISYGCFMFRVTPDGQAGLSAGA